MFSTIFYSRAGVPRSVQITTKRMPNIVAVKFTVIAAEIEEGDSIPSLDDHVFLDELLLQLDIVIFDVVPRKGRK